MSNKGIEGSVRIFTSNWYDTGRSMPPLLPLCGKASDEIRRYSRKSSSRREDDEFFVVGRARRSEGSEGACDEITTDNGPHDSKPAKAAIATNVADFKSLAR